MTSNKPHNSLNYLLLERFIFEQFTHALWEQKIKEKLKWEIQQWTCCVNVKEQFDVRSMIKALIYGRQEINMFQPARSALEGAYLAIIAGAWVRHKEFCKSGRVCNTPRDLQNSSCPTKAEFNNCFIIHSKYPPILKGVSPFRSLFFCSIKN